MACSRNESCNYLANVTYPNYKVNINENIDKINTGLEDIREQFSEMDVPSDYLGGKVLEELGKITEEITDKISDLSTTKQKVNVFINNKISEHRGHYNDWKYRQELQRSSDSQETKEETEKTTSTVVSSTGGKKFPKSVDFTSQV